MYDYENLRMGHFWNRDQFRRELDKANPTTYFMYGEGGFEEIQGLLELYLADDVILDADIISSEDIN